MIHEISRPLGGKRAVFDDFWWRRHSDVSVCQRGRSESHRKGDNMTTGLCVPSQPPSSVNTSQAGDGKNALSLAACPDDGLSAFLRVRARLFGIGYRILGNAAEAEDVVQDVWLRWQTTIAVWFATPRHSS